MHFQVQASEELTQAPRDVCPEGAGSPGLDATARRPSSARPRGPTLLVAAVVCVWGLKFVQCLNLLAGPEAQSPSEQMNA